MAPGTPLCRSRQLVLVQGVPALDTYLCSGTACNPCATVTISWVPPLVFPFVQHSMSPKSTFGTPSKHVLGTVEMGQKTSSASQFQHNWDPKSLPYQPNTPNCCMGPPNSMCFDKAFFRQGGWGGSMKKHRGYGNTSDSSRSPNGSQLACLKRNTALGLWTPTALSIHGSHLLCC